MAEHEDITGSSNIHEEKHISDASTSDAGKVVTPSSTNNGVGELRKLLLQELNLENSYHGQLNAYGNYSDSTYTSGSPLALTAGVRTQLPCDALGGSTTEVDMPSGVSFWDAGTNTVTPENVDDCYDIRVIFKAEPTTNNEDVKLELDIGGGVGVILSETRPLLRGAAQNDLVFSWDIFCKATFLANGGTLYVTASDATNVWDIGVYIVRVRRGA